MNRRGFITGAMALITAPAIVRAESLEYVPRLHRRTLVLFGKDITISKPLVLDPAVYKRVEIRRCTIRAADDFVGKSLVEFMRGGQFVEKCEISHSSFLCNQRSEYGMFFRDVCHSDLPANMSGLRASEGSGGHFTVMT